MINLPPELIERKNLLGDTGAWIVLLEVIIPPMGGLTEKEILRFASDNRKDYVRWNGYDWVCFPFDIDTIGESSKNEVPKIVVKVSNINRMVQYYVEQANGGVGATVNLYVVHSEHLDVVNNVPKWTFDVNGTSTDEEWCRFELGASSPYNMNFPKHKVLKNFCRWEFKSVECGYTGSATECDRSLTRCKELNNTERFGNCPGVGRRGLYV